MKKETRTVVYDDERIYLDQICRCANLSKSTLLRAFR